MNDLIWHRLKLTLARHRQMPNNLDTPNTYIILQTIVKRICTQDSIVKRICTQDSDETLNRTVSFNLHKGFSEKWRLNENISINIFVTRGLSYANKFKDNVYKVTPPLPHRRAAIIENIIMLLQFCLFYSIVII